MLWCFALNSGGKCIFHPGNNVLWSHWDQNVWLCVCVCVCVEALRHGRPLIDGWASPGCSMAATDRHSGNLAPEVPPPPRNTHTRKAHTHTHTHTFLSFPNTKPQAEHPRSGGCLPTCPPHLVAAWTCQVSASRAPEWSCEHMEPGFGFTGCMQCGNHKGSTFLGKGLKWNMLLCVK